MKEDIEDYNEAMKQKAKYLVLYNNLKREREDLIKKINILEDELKMLKK